MKLIPWKNKRAELAHFPEATWPSRLGAEIDSWLENIWREPLGMLEGPPSELAFGPRLDLAESDKHVTVRVELPGVQKEDVKIETSGRLLTVSGEKKEEREQKGHGFQHRERVFGSFTRTVELPPTANPEKVEATFKDGVLVIKVAKRTDLKVKQIPVKAE